MRDGHTEKLKPRTSPDGGAEEDDPVAVRDAYPTSMTSSRKGSRSSCR